MSFRSALTSEDEDETRLEEVQHQNEGNLSLRNVGDEEEKGQAEAGHSKEASPQPQQQVRISPPKKKQPRNVLLRVKNPREN